MKKLVRPVTVPRLTGFSETGADIGFVQRDKADKKCKRGKKKLKNNDNKITLNEF